MTANPGQGASGVAPAAPKVRRLLVRMLIVLADHCAEHSYMGPMPYFIIPPVPDSAVHPAGACLTRAERKAFARLTRNWNA